MTLNDWVNNLRAYRNTVNALSFSEADKKVFKKEIVLIADTLLSVNYHISFSPYLPDEFVGYVQQITIWLEKLNDSYNYRLNEEMTFCIKELIAKWDSHNAARLVIFTLGDYSVQKAKRNRVSNNIDELLTISKRTGIPITKEPVFIQVPDEFKDHIVANVVLFHEVGHFVDRDNYVTDLVYDEILPELNKNNTSRFRREWFPRFNGVDISTVSDAVVIIKNYIGEYIADVFGAQYAGEHILCYLSFLMAKSSNDDTKKHPSLNCRKKMVESFLYYCKNGKANNLLLASIINYIPGLATVSCPFSEAQLLDPNLCFADSEQMFNSFISLWNYVMRETKRQHIKKAGAKSYSQVLDLPYYKKLDKNIKRAINELKNRP